MKIRWAELLALILLSTSCNDDASDKNSNSSQTQTNTGDDSSNVYCYEKCDENALTQCVSGNVATCEKNASGCARWVVQTLCSAEQTCDAETLKCVPRPEGKRTTLRLMAGNITSGTNQTYDLGHGTRIFQTLKPDIAMIQEFNLKSKTREEWVTSTFGEDFRFVFSENNIPNGIISKYPILDSGYWASNIENSRNWDWAVIDIPGSRDLLAISVHLHTSKNPEEYPVLIEKIKAKQAEGNYHVVIAGDFNTPNRDDVQKNFAGVFNVRGPWPVDQNGREGTDANRNDRDIDNQRPLDWVLMSYELDALEIPITVGEHTYADGHILDSRVYAGLCSVHANTDELADIPPVDAADSSYLQMQHMAVVRDVAILSE